MELNDWQLNSAHRLTQSWRRRRQDFFFLPSRLAGTLVTTSASPLYCASKAGVLGYLRSHGVEEREESVRMVALCPSLTDTPLIRSTSLPLLTVS